jgi:hypothetical protein
LNPEDKYYEVSELTSLSDQQEEPDTPRQVQYERDSVARAPEESDDTEEDLGDLSRKPGPVGVCDGWIRGYLVRDGGFADKWRCEAPAKTDDEEG